jgi:hypothetical protein
MKWKAYYTDSITEPVLKCITSSECEPAEIPGFGIVGIAVEDDRVGWRFHRSSDFYIYADTWYGMDWLGFVDHVGNSTEPVIVKLGRNVPDSIWQEFIKLKLPKKSAYYQNERK